MPSKCQNVKVAGLKAFKKCPIFWSDLVKMSDVRPNWDGVVTGLVVLKHIIYKWRKANPQGPSLATVWVQKHYNNREELTNKQKIM